MSEGRFVLTRIGQTLVVTLEARPMPEVLYVRYGSLADIRQAIRDVRFTPNSGHDQRPGPRPLSATSGHEVYRVGGGSIELGFTDRIQAIIFHMSSVDLTMPPIGGIGPTTFSELWRLKPCVCSSSEPSATKRNSVSSSLP